MSRRKKQQSDAPGEDSFLDVVANLVGILIILVMVIGAQAHESWQKSAREEVAKRSETAPELAKAASLSRQSQAIERQNVELQRQIAEEELAAQLLSAERDAIQLAVLQIEQQIKAQEESKTDLQRRQLAAQNEAAELRSKIDQVKRQTAIASQKPTENVDTLDHYPSPIAKTVFGDELHFRLNAGRIAYVPMQELIDLLRLEIEVKGNALAVNQQTTSTVGPIDNFRMKYQLSAAEMSQRNGDMIVRRKVAHVDQFELLPASQEMGVPITEALQPRSDFFQRLAGSDPTTTTISVWVYPNSYTEFRELKQTLAKQGFKIAAWPLPADRPISGSPNGYQSAAQ